MSELDEVVKEFLVESTEGLDELDRDLVALEQAPQDQRLVGTIALANDGRRLAFTAREPGGSTKVWIRALGDPKAEMLRGTEGAELPFWSPDGKSVAFFAGGELKRIAISGGPPQTIAATTPDIRGASWGADGRIVFAPTLAGPLMLVSASGGKPRPATTLDKGRNEGTHRWPWFLPDGRHFLYYAAAGAGAEPGEIFAGDLGSGNGNVKHITQSSSLAVYASPGYLLFVRGGTLPRRAADARMQVPGLGALGEHIDVQRRAVQGTFHLDCPARRRG